MNRDLAVGELDAVFPEQVLQAGVDDLAQNELLARLGHEFHPGHHCRILHRHDALRLQRLQEHRTVFRIVHQLLAELLDDLAHLFDIGVISHPERQLHHRPVAGEVLDMLDSAERNGCQWPTVMAQLHGADGNFLDDPLGAADIDVFPHPERIVDQVEGP